MDIINALRVVVALLLTLQSNPNIPVEQRQQVLDFSGQVVAVAQLYVAEWQVQPEVQPVFPVINIPTTITVSTSTPVPQPNPEPVAQPNYIVTIKQAPKVPEQKIKFSVEDKEGKPVIKLDKIESNMTYQTFLGIGSDTGEYEIYVPDLSVENPTLTLTIAGEKIVTPVK